MSLDARDIQSWIGRQSQLHDQLRLQPVQFMQATLDRDATLQAGDELPFLWHWLFFLEAKRQSELGRDAHPQKGGFLPPVTLPRRMWAGGRFTFHRPLIIGEPASKISTIKSIAHIFHGPLTATLLIDLACKIFGAKPKSFSFKGLAPLANLNPFHLEGCRQANQLELWARRDDGAMAMAASAVF